VVKVVGVSGLWGEQRHASVETTMVKGAGEQECRSAREQLGRVQ
jgi:hypothetical protein